MTDSITCPRCEATSHNPKDIEEGYCGNCHDWTSGAFSGLAFREYIQTGEVPEWRKRVINRMAIRASMEEMLGYQAVKIKCPGCDAELLESDYPAQVEHMEKHHPEIIEERLRAAGFVRGPSGAWIDTLAEE